MAKTTETFSVVLYINEANTWQQGAAVSFDEARAFAAQVRATGRYCLVKPTKEIECMGLPEGAPAKLAAWNAHDRSDKDL